VQEFGFSDVVGHVSFEKSQGVKPFSKKLQTAMDLEAKQIIAKAYKMTGMELLSQFPEYEGS
jgi:ATP-dependent Zn protease